MLFSFAPVAVDIVCLPSVERHRIANPPRDVAHRLVDVHRRCTPTHRMLSYRTWEL